MSLGYINRQRVGEVARGPDEPPVLVQETPAVVPALDKRAPPTRRLLRWNLAMTVFHAGLAATTLAVGNLGLRIPLYSTNLQFLEGNATLSDLAFELVPRYARFASFPATWITAAFFACSALGHAGNALLWRRFYESELAQCRCTTRWIEYFFSAPLMFALIAVACGVREYTLLVALATLIATTIPFGYITECVATVEHGTWVRPFRQRIAPHVVGYLPQTAAWACVFAGFYDESDADRPPAFVHAILWSQLLLFWSFGAVQLWQQLSPPSSYTRGEMAYQVLSLASKGTLGSLLLTNVIMLDSADDALAR